MELLTASLQIKRTLKFKFQCSEFKLNDSFGSQYGSLSQYSFCETFRSLCARKWRANCDTLWTAATGIKSRRGRYFVDVRGNIRACRSSRRKAGTRRATSTGTSSEKRLWREQRDAWSNEERNFFTKLIASLTYNWKYINWYINNKTKSDRKTKSLCKIKVIYNCKILNYPREM